MKGNPFEKYPDSKRIDFIHKVEEKNYEYANFREPENLEKLKNLSSLVESRRNVERKIYRGPEAGIDKYIYEVENPGLAADYWHVVQNPTKKYDPPNPWRTSLIKFNLKYFLYFVLGLITAIVFTVLSVNEWNRISAIQNKDGPIGYFILLAVIGFIFFIRSFFGMYNSGMFNFLRPEAYKNYKKEKTHEETIMAGVILDEQRLISRYERYKEDFIKRQAKLKQKAKNIGEQIKNFDILPSELKPHAPELYEYFLHNQYERANVIDALYKIVDDIRKQEKEQASKEYWERREQEERAREIAKEKEQEARDLAMQQILTRLNAIDESNKARENEIDYTKCLNCMHRDHCPKTSKADCHFQSGRPGIYK